MRLKLTQPSLAGVGAGAELGKKAMNLSPTFVVDCTPQKEEKKYGSEFKCSGCV